MKSRKKIGYNLDSNEVGIYALGGLGEVGKNMYCVEYKDEILIMDAGILFPDDNLLGIDYVIPDYTHLEENREKISGLFITHGHEDHIGGVTYLLKKVHIPHIYANGLAKGLIEHKIAQDRSGLKPSIIEFQEDDVIKTKHFDVTFFRTTHSIADSFGIIIDTPQGKVVNMGDFKVDHTPIGHKFNLGKLAKAGNDGVLCLLSDSTNAELDGTTISEKKVSDSIKEMFRNIKGRIIISTFASNIFRVQQIVEASVQTNRHIAVFGRSMEKTVDVGQQLGYIKAPEGTFISSKEIKNYPSSKVTILSTGSQGEQFAALNRIAQGVHNDITLMEDDTVIFSSSPIPGNLQSVGNVINLLFKKGVNVITNNPLTETHSSGHGGKDELRLIISLAQPKYFLPVHGEHRMQKIHSDLAVEMGVKEENSFVLNNGDVLAVSKESGRFAGRTQSGDVYIDGKGIGDIGSAVIRDRKIMSQDGLLSIIITINKKGEIPIPINIISRGFIYMKSNERLTSSITKKAYETTNNALKQGIKDIEEFKETLSFEINKFIYEKTQRKPMILPIILEM